MALTNAEINIIVRAFDQASAVLGVVSEEISNIEQIASRMQMTGLGLTLIGGALIAPALKAVDTFKDLESAFRDVVARAGEFDDVAGAMERVQKIVFDTATTTKFSAQELAEASSAFVQRGLSLSDLESSLGDLAKFTQAANGELQGSFELVLNTMAAYRMELSELSNVTDMFSTAIKDSPLDIDRLAKSLVYVAPTAYAANESIVELMATLMTLGEMGIYGEKAGTSVRRMLASLSAPTNEARTAIESVGFSVEQLSLSYQNMGQLIEVFKKRFKELGWINLDPVTGEIVFMEEHLDKISALFREVFDIRAMNTMKALLSAGNSEWERYKQILIDAGGTTDKMADIQMSSLANAIEIVKSKLNELSYSIVQTEDNPIKKFVSGLGDMIDKFNAMDDGMKNAILKMALYGGTALIASGGLLIITGTLLKLGSTLRSIALGFEMMGKFAISAISKIAAFLAAHPIGWVLIGIAAAVFAAKKAFDAFSTSKATDSLSKANSYLALMSGSSLKAQASISELDKTLGRIVPQTGESENPLEQYQAYLDDFNTELQKTGSSTRDFYAVIGGQVTSITLKTLESSQIMLSGVKSDITKARIYTDRETAAWGALVDSNFSETLTSMDSKLNSFRMAVNAALGIHKFDIIVGVDDAELQALKEDLESIAETNYTEKIRDDLAEAAQIWNAGLEEANISAEKMAAQVSDIAELLNKRSTETTFNVDTAGAFVEMSDTLAKTDALQKVLGAYAENLQASMKESGTSVRSYEALINDMTAAVAVFTAAGMDQETAIQSAYTILSKLLMPATEQGAALIRAFGFDASQTAEDVLLIKDAWEKLYVLEDTDLAEIFGSNLLVKDFRYATSVIDTMMNMMSAFGSMMENREIIDWQASVDELDVLLQRGREKFTSGDPFVIKDSITENIAEGLKRALDIYKITPQDLVETFEVLIDPRAEFDFSGFVEAAKMSAATGAPLDAALEEMAVYIDEKTRSRLSEIGIEPMQLAEIIELVIGEDIDVPTNELNTRLRDALLYLPEIVTGVNVYIIPQVDNLAEIASIIETQVGSQTYKIADIISLVNIAVKFGVNSEAFMLRMKELNIDLESFLDLLKFEYDIKLEGTSKEDIKTQLDSLEKEVGSRTFAVNLSPYVPDIPTQYADLELMVSDISMPPELAARVQLYADEFGADISEQVATVKLYADDSGLRIADLQAQVSASLVIDREQVDSEIRDLQEGTIATIPARFYIPEIPPLSADIDLRVRDVSIPDDLVANVSLLAKEFRPLINSQVATVKYYPDTSNLAIDEQVAFVRAFLTFSKEQVAFALSTIEDSTLVRVPVSFYIPEIPTQYADLVLRATEVNIPSNLTATVSLDAEELAAGIRQQLATVKYYPDFSNIVIDEYQTVVHGYLEMDRERLNDELSNVGTAFANVEFYIPVIPMQRAGLELFVTGVDVPALVERLRVNAVMPPLESVISTAPLSEELNVFAALDDASFNRVVEAADSIEDVTKVVRFVPEELSAEFDSLSASVGILPEMNMTAFESVVARLNEIPDIERVVTFIPRFADADAANLNASVNYSALLSPFFDTYAFDAAIEQFEATRKIALAIEPAISGLDLQQQIAASVAIDFDDQINSNNRLMASIDRLTDSLPALDTVNRVASIEYAGVPRVDMLYSVSIGNMTFPVDLSASDDEIGKEFARQLRFARNKNFGMG